MLPGKYQSHRNQHDIPIPMIFLYDIQSHLLPRRQAESGRENFDPDAFLETMEPDRRQALRKFIEVASMFLGKL